ncbi:DUF6973 domain-containing protein [Bacillus albus]|uniref:DUF6973 domain-containing protein n=1 Tax=Bacillus albus TaxID=2026189 RepID=UPI0018A169B6|nr:hypothetical protein [Bacillus albus]MBF7156477.1 hypothetical protein [Bacillus albus]
MKKTKNLKKLGMAALATTILAGGFLPSNSYAEEKDSTNLKPFVSNMPESARTLNFVDTNANKKEYLTNVEVQSINPNKLNSIYKELENDAKNGSYTEEQLNKIAAEKIKNNGTKARTSYSIPGFGSLTSAEVNLAKNNPWEFTIYSAAAVSAKGTAEDYYGSSQLYQGNGDAFRHAYWNAILVKRLGGTKGRDHGEGRAQIWTDAHESTSSGIDKEMDLHNNYMGRMRAYNDYNGSLNSYSSALRQAVANGSMARIVNGQLVSTNGVTGK